MKDFPATDTRAKQAGDSKGTLGCVSTSSPPQQKNPSYLSLLWVCSRAMYCSSSSLPSCRQCLSAFSKLSLALSLSLAICLTWLLQTQRAGHYETPQQPTEGPSSQGAVPLPEALQFVSIGGASCMLKATPGDHECAVQSCRQPCQAHLLLRAAALPLQEQHRLRSLPPCSNSSNRISVLTLSDHPPVFQGCPPISQISLDHILLRLPPALG